MRDSPRIRILVAEERAGLLRKVAKLYAGPMQNPDLAFVSASRALRELPDEEASLTLAVTLSDRASHGGEELASTKTKGAVEGGMDAIKEKIGLGGGGDDDDDDDDDGNSRSRSRSRSRNR